MVRMRSDDKEVIENNFSRYASRYDAYSCVQDLAAGELIAMAPRLEFRNILDLGCGTGTYTLYLADAFKKSSITAVDISSAMVNAAMLKCGVSNIKFIVARAEEIVCDRQFDLITSNATFQWIPDLASALVRYREMLSDDGMILFSTFGPMTFSELGASLRAVQGSAMTISAESFLTKDEVTAMMKSNFRESAVEERVITREYRSLFELLRHIRYTGTRGRGVEGLSGSRNVFDRIERAYRDTFGGIVATYQIFFCKGRR